jgi:hypothetical protein
MVALPSAVPQEVKHAATVEQCQADERVWSQQFYASPALISIKTLQAWQQEMHECGTVDPSHKPLYHNFFTELSLEEGDRALNFLMRHELYDQFVAEDETGKRGIR